MGEAVQIIDAEEKMCIEEEDEQIEHEWSINIHISFYYFACVLHGMDSNQFVLDDTLEVGFISGEHTLIVICSK